MTVTQLGTGLPCRRQATLKCRAQRAVSDAYGIIVNVITSDQHNWCARPARARPSSHSAQTCLPLIHRTRAMPVPCARKDVHAVQMCMLWHGGWKGGGSW